MWYTCQPGLENWPEADKSFFLGLRRELTTDVNEVMAKLADCARTTRAEVKHTHDSQMKQCIKGLAMQKLNPAVFEMSDLEFRLRD